MANPKDMNQILTMEPMKLSGWLYETYINAIPTPQSSQEFRQHSHLLADIANAYAFLASTHAAASIMVRSAKRKKADKDVIDDCIDRRDAIDDCLRALKMQYEAFSRMITVQKQADEELKMLGEV